MSGTLILHGYTGVGLIGTGMEYFLDGNSIAKVKKNGTERISIEKGGILTAKFGGIRKSSNSVLIKDGKITEISMNHNVVTGGFKIDVVSVNNVDSSDSDSTSESESENPIYTLDGGVKDILYIYEDYIIISHLGVLNAMTMGIKGDKTLYYSDITSVQFKKPGITAGYIQFSIPGGNENRGGVFSAMSDENTIAIAQNAPIYEIEEMVEYINRKIREVKNNKGASTTVVNQISAADELKKFKELLDSGVITQEEFDAKEKQLLGL